MFCKIFINSELNEKELEKKIVLMVNGRLDRFTIVSDTFELSLFKNDDFKACEGKKFPDGFLYFSFFLEINSIAEKNLFIESIGNLLKTLWEGNFPAVAACDFEKALPCNGGYGSEEIPWPSHYI
jgi:hypothetical protein